MAKMPTVMSQLHKKRMRQTSSKEDARQSEMNSVFERIAMEHAILQQNYEQQQQERFAEEATQEQDIEDIQDQANNSTSRDVPRHIPSMRNQGETTVEFIPTWTSADMFDAEDNAEMSTGDISSQAGQTQEATRYASSRFTSGLHPTDTSAGHTSVPPFLRQSPKQEAEALRQKIESEVQMAQPVYVATADRSARDVLARKQYKHASAAGSLPSDEVSEPSFPYVRLDSNSNTEIETTSAEEQHSYVQPTTYGASHDYAQGLEEAKIGNRRNESDGIRFARQPEVARPPASHQAIQGDSDEPALSGLDELSSIASELGLPPTRSRTTTVPRVSKADQQPPSASSSVSIGKALKQIPALGMRLSDDDLSSQYSERIDRPDILTSSELELSEPSLTNSLFKILRQGKEKGGSSAIRASSSINMSDLSLASASDAEESAQVFNIVACIYD